jgi:hypothetical protein
VAVGTLAGQQLVQVGRSALLVVEVQGQRHGVRARQRLDGVDEGRVLALRAQ